ncbi:unnamed protein product, partial [Medioppia subpectinata]
MSNQMFGYFDGDFRRRPQQSLGGSHRETQRQQLLQKAAEERRDREELRRRTNCAIVIQSFIRGCLARKRQCSQMRKEYDDTIDRLSKSHENPSLDAIEHLIHEFIVFYCKAKDTQRLNWLSQQLVKQKDIIGPKVITDTNHWLYRIKCILEFNISELESMAGKQASIAIPMRALEVFTGADVYDKCCA